MIIDNWQQLKSDDPKTLNDSITMMHHAAQAVAAFGNSLLPKAADDSQSSLSWHSDLKALVSQEVNLKRRVRIALSYNSFKLHMLNADDTSMGSLPISGQTKTTALSFVRIQAREMGRRAEEVNMPDHYDLPESDYDKGAPFIVQGVDKHLELAKYRHNAQELLGAIARQYEHASTVAIWPHHFDTGSVINVDFDDVGEPTKTVGIGMAIPDDVCEELYFYVNHWSKDGDFKYDELPELSNGAKWKTEGFKGAILPVSTIIKGKSAEAQCQLTEQFLREAIEASIKLLDAEPAMA